MKAVPAAAVLPSGEPYQPEASARANSIPRLRFGLVWGAVARSRAADYLELAKPRVAVLVLFTVAAGGWLAGLADGQGLVLLHTVFATALIATGASALNQAPGTPHRRPHGPH